MQVKPIVLTALRTELQEACDAFLLNQSTERWRNLEDAMYALQYAGQRTEQRIIEITTKLEVAGWCPFFNKLARAQIKK